MFVHASHHTRPFVICASLSVLMACGGSSSSPPIDVDPASDDIGGRAATLTRDAASGDFTVEIGGARIMMTALPTHDNGTFIAGEDAGATNNGFYFSETADSSVLLVRPDPADINGGPSTSFARLDASTIPTSGSATVTGDYQGIAQGGTEGDITALVDGDASLEIDFDAQTIEGLVTNRIPRNPVDSSTIVEGIGPFDDLRLRPAVIGDDGAFTTATDGGGANLALFPLIEVSGTYAGLVAADGTEVVAGVSIEHNFGAGGLLEIGAIAAGH